jgi:hypothetical protein
VGFCLQSSTLQMTAAQISLTCMVIAAACCIAPVLLARR